MGNITITSKRYSVDPLYQWDTNQVLTIYGLSLSKIPEIHFSNSAMDRAIVRQATMDNTGVISVNVPNSLLQKPYQITAYICLYEGDTFETLYKIDIPVKARKEPMDYVFVDDNDEIYSFNALDNRVTNALAEIREEYNAIDGKYNETVAEKEIAVEKLNEAETAYKNASRVLTDCENATAECERVTKQVVQDISGKENKSVIVEKTLLASGWSENTYSFENEYPASQYSLEISLNDTADLEQFDAFNYALLVGSATTNTVKAYGDVPSIDIPIIVKVVEK